MKNFIKSLFFLFILFSLNADAQNLTNEECGSEFIHKKLMQTDSKYRDNYLDAQNKIQSILKDPKELLERTAEDVYSIPVVVHVLNLGEPVGTGYNISDAQIQGAINGLNDRFSNTIGSGLDIGIRFCLASRDPDNCPTTGIVRINASSYSTYVSSGVWTNNQDTMMNLSNWPKSDYYNIWVVNMVDGGSYSGYTTYQFSTIGGTVIDAGYMTYGSTTITHEAGHLLNLLHTYTGDGSGGTCPIDTNCSMNGDYICDTPPHKRGDCGTVNPCSATGVWDNSRYNYLSYCGTRDRFTPDQKTRMRAYILSSAFLQMANNSISCDISLHATYSKTDVSTCHGSCDGSITAIPLGCSTQSFNFNWSTGQTTQTISGLCAGTYTVTVIDANNSASATTESITIAEPAELSINISTDTISCNYGTATANVSGGTPYHCEAPFPLTIGTLVNYNGNTEFPAPYGNYYNSSKHILQFYAPELHALGFSAGTIYSIALNIQSISGASTYTNWQINIGPVTPSITVFGPQDITISTGWNTYTFNVPYVWDGVSDVFVEFCFANATSTNNSSTYYMGTPFVIPTATNFERSNIEDVCTVPQTTAYGSTHRPTTQFNICTDTTYYHYLWSNGQTTQTATGLIAGLYSVLVTDVNGCIKTQNFIVPSSVTVSLIGSTLTTSCPTSGCTYQWYKDGVPVCTNSPTCTYTGLGNYTVVITDSFGCIFSGSYLTVGIEEIKAQNYFSIHPNPAFESFTIDINEQLKAEHFELRLYNILGEQIFINMFDGIQETIDSKSFPPGVYFVKLSNGKNEFTQKLIIE